MSDRRWLCALWIVAVVLVGVGITSRNRAGAQDATAGAPGGQPQASISAELAEVEKLAGAGDIAGAAARCRRILELARASRPETLTGTDWFGIGTAHYYLMAEGFDKALQAGGLDTERANIARQWRDHVAGVAAEPAIQVIGQGARVNLSDYVVRGKTTVFDFYSEYCPPCRAIAPALEKLAQSRSDVVVVKVDINRPGVRGIDWRSPTAEQFRIRSIPHFKIYGPDGRLKAEDKPASSMLQQMLAIIGR
jgi:thiol-disulfide isomerase/thioredoxin